MFLDFANGPVTTRVKGRLDSKSCRGEMTARQTNTEFQSLDQGRVFDVQVLRCLWVTFTHHHRPDR